EVANRVARDLGVEGKQRSWKPGSQQPGTPLVVIYAAHRRFEEPDVVLEAHVARRTVGPGGVSVWGVRRWHSTLPTLVVLPGARRGTGALNAPSYRGCSTRGELRARVYRRPTRVSSELSAVSRQPSAVSCQTSDVSRQLSAVSGLPRQTSLWLA